ncbi:hypothetical protein GCM10009555_083950 [Acrocarpospora macrocephala]|uniref:Protein kinase domain-containing protein n=1 Tax=Acrocarpospora macrocephala TaxID=150177 RepID=A0A5M3WXP0_9ACTN|nr:hypothetical protein [Acrocarpospora macrocephala]GES13510.1 hypothetical protein Amac_071070 [Acrocarpospora macrocephala]
MHDGGSVAGHRLTGRVRISEVGTWHDAVAPDGTPSGLLRFEQRLLADPAARDRLVAAVSADRRLQQGGHTGLLPVADLVTARGDVWLISGRRAMPTVAELLVDGGRTPDSGSAATILVESAQALLTLHAAGLTHGALHPGTIVIGEDGTALLAERGLLEALRSEPTSVERDVAAWSGLARGLAASWAAGQSAQLLDRAAAMAATRGLSAARDTLLGGRDVLPAGFTTRERLVQTLHVWSSASVPTSPPPAAVPETGEMRTLLDPAVFRGQDPTQPGPRSGPSDGQGLRFGPGVPVETSAAQIWRQGQSTQHTPDLRGHVGPVAAKRPSRRRTAWAGSILLAILVAAVILWIRQAPGLVLEVAKVDVRAPKKVQGCDSTAKIVALVSTNGGAGTFSYVWEQSDGRKTRQTQRVESDTKSVELPLLWKVTGPGTLKGTATLRILDHTATGKPIQDRASFSYKC